MQFKNIGFRVPGLYSAASISLADARMSTTAKQRRDALAFWQKHGLVAAIGYAGVCRSTLHAWQAAYRKRGVVDLASRCRAPSYPRTRSTPRAPRPDSR